MTTEQNRSPPKHTPEPWQYDPETGLIHSLDRTLICDTCSDPDSPVHDANGYLIDTAPQLLEGAERTVATFDSIKHLLPGDFLKNHGHPLAMGIEALRDAIATATRGNQ